jgi:hypothetical protein
MPVSNIEPYFSVASHGGNTYPFAFKIFDASELVVKVDGTAKTLGLDYTVTITAEPGEGGSIIFQPGYIPPAGTLTVEGERSVTTDRSTDYQEAGGFRQNVVDKDFDRLVMMAQDGKTDRGRLQGLIDSTLAKIAQLAVSGSTLLDNFILTFRPLDIITKGPWLDSRAYATFEEAVAAANAASRNLLFSVDQNVTADLVINVELMPLNGAVINYGAHAITYAGSTARWPLAQIFSGTGAVSLPGANEVHPVWWGFSSSASAAVNVAAMTAAINASQFKRLILPSGTFNCTGGAFNFNDASVVFESTCTLTGATIVFNARTFKNRVYFDNDLYLRGNNDGRTPHQPLLYAINPYDGSTQKVLQVGPEQEMRWGPATPYHSNFFDAPLDLFKPHVHIDFREKGTFADNKYLTSLVSGTGVVGLSQSSGRNALVLSLIEHNDKASAYAGNILIQKGSYARLYFYFQETESGRSGTPGNKIVFAGFSSRPTDPLTVSAGNKAFGFYRENTTGTAFGTWFSRRMIDAAYNDVPLTANTVATQTYGTRKLHIMDVYPNEVRYYIMNGQGLFNYSQPDGVHDISGIADGTFLYPFFITQAYQSPTLLGDLYTIISDIYFIGNT